MEWISVNKQIPPDGRYILLTDGKQVIPGWHRNPQFVSKAAYEKRPYQSWSGVIHQNITHWMYLPEPPKGE